MNIKAKTLGQIHYRPWLRWMLHKILRHRERRAFISATKALRRSAKANERLAQATAAVRDYEALIM